ncbi:MAG: hypothetical protein GY759_10820 [Chloroflexi bacterium]|nr:hypothetical protein [Chloroflexota bacterium]
MARRRKRNVTRTRQRHWKTTVWYVIGALIVIAMVFSLFAGAFSAGF